MFTEYIEKENIETSKSSKKWKIQYIDFGLIENIADSGNSINQNKKPRGSYNFKSRNCHEGLIPYRKDELESIIYILIHMLNSFLPWFNIKADEGQSTNRFVLRIK